MNKTKMTKDTIPEDFTIGLALVDALPVFFFGLACLFAFFLTKELMIILGGLIAFVSGLIKVIWKIIVAIKKKNIWWMYVQMRIALPIGMLLAIAGFVAWSIIAKEADILAKFANPISIVFYALTLIGMAAMVVCSIKLDSSDKKANWIEQICNSFAELCLFIACLVAFLL
ncbi:MAG: hypothetical protein MJ241_04890 [Bacilli bacterium]|nr:hypothetical protein [Bacilli bacterium]